METNAALPTRSELFDALKNIRRRYVLYYLKHRDDSVELGELAEQVAAWENDTSVESISPEDRKSVYSALHQTHLPKLETTGVLTYDAERGVVSLSERASEFELRLANDPQTSLPWQRLYLGLFAAGTAVAVLVRTGVPPFDLLSGFGLTALILAALGGSALCHAYDRHRWRTRMDGAAPDLLLELNE